MHHQKEPSNFLFNKKKIFFKLNSLHKTILDCFLSFNQTFKFGKFIRKISSTRNFLIYAQPINFLSRLYVDQEAAMFFLLKYQFIFHYQNFASFNMTNMTTATVRYSDEDLQNFRVLIDSKLEKAYQEVQSLKEQMSEVHENNSNGQSGDWTDESSSQSQIELLNNMLSRQQIFVRNLEQALMRIKNKTYGICTVSGHLIDKDRLRLVPHATKSVEVKNARPVINNGKHAIAEGAKQHREEEPNNEHDDAGLQKEFFENR